MPYPRAHYWVAFVLLVTVVGFWPSYFMKLSEAPLGFHVHAVTSLVWTAIVMVQSWGIHHRKRGLHKALGKASLALFPFLIVGFVMIINISAESFLTRDDPFSQVAKSGMGATMLVAIVAYCIVFHQALAKRRNVMQHAGFMLTTPLILFESPFSRIMIDHAPWTVFTGATGMYFILDAIVIAMVLSIVFAMIVWARDRANHKPFLIVSILLALEAVAMRFAGEFEAWRIVFGVYGRLPDSVTIGVGFALVAIVVLHGWKSGSKPKPAAPKVAI